MEMKAVIEIMNQIQVTLDGTNLKYPIELPRIAVIGAQSTGKSSVLEAIVGEDFLPRGSGIVTTCPLILQLVNSKDEVKIAKFEHLEEEFKDFEAIKEEISRKMHEHSGDEKKIVDKPIYLKITGNDLPDLTLIDLPGFTNVNTDDQNKEIIQEIEDLSMKYIKEDNTIILALSAANDDIANSVSLKYATAENIDPQRVRTIGVLTKADLVDDENHSCSQVTNNKLKLKHGYILVKCRGKVATENGLTVKDALKEEEEFFEGKTAYKELPEKQGILSLSSKLSRILTEHILRVLPKIEHLISINLKDFMDREAELGPALQLDTLADQRKAILNMIDSYCRNFSFAIEHSVNGSMQQSGGIEILKIFKEFARKDLKAVDPLKDISNYEILVEMRKWSGISQRLFVPEEVCRGLIQNTIKTIEPPIYTCIHRVIKVLMKSITASMDQDFIHRKKLKSYIIKKMEGLIQEKYEMLEKELNVKLECERAYINFIDEDFVSLRPHAVNTADIGDATKNSLVASFSVDKNAFTPLANLGDKPENWDQNYSFDSEVTLSSIGKSSKIFDRESVEEVKLNDEIESDDITNVWVIKKVVHCYFASIKKHYKADIPKYIVNFLIKKTTEDMRSLLITDILNFDNLDDFIGENKETKKLRKLIRRNIDKLEGALVDIERINQKREENGF